MSSSGCETRPAKAEPCRPVASLATVPRGTRRCVGTRANGPRELAPNYFGENGNLRSLQCLIHAVRPIWRKRLCRRSQRTRLNWKRFEALYKRFPLPVTRISVQLWSLRSRAASTVEPDGGHLLVRIWGGARLGNRRAYSTDSAALSRPQARDLRIPPMACAFGVSTGWFQSRCFPMAGGGSRS